MIPLEQLTLFILTSLVILVIPGPAVLYIITRSISQGRTAGITSVVGVNLYGCSSFWSQCYFNDKYCRF
jgi:threonine/homoserine/homoserine lactone efflux protein